MARREGATTVERALIEALPARYQRNEVVSGEEFSAWDDAFAGAMRNVHRRFPHDPDVVTLFAESLITRTPWQLWDRDSGEPADGAATVEARNVLEASMQARSDGGKPPHAGMLHMYIHVMEMSPMPECALATAETLHHLSPDNGHLNHMPCHIFLQCGRYTDALAGEPQGGERRRQVRAPCGPLQLLHDGALSRSPRHDERGDAAGGLPRRARSVAEDRADSDSGAATPGQLTPGRDAGQLLLLGSPCAGALRAVARDRGHFHAYPSRALRGHDPHAPLRQRGRPRGARRLRGGEAGTLELRCGMRRPVGDPPLLQ